MMDREDILRRVNEIFWDVFDDDTIVVEEQTTAADVEDWDSLSHITLVSEIEEAFGMKFEMKEVLGMKDVGEMLDILQERATR